jgi:hypothetical protein
MIPSANLGVIGLYQGIVVKGKHPLVVICDDRPSALTQGQASCSRHSGRHAVEYRHRVHVVWRKSPGDDSHLFGDIVLAQPLRKGYELYFDIVHLLPLKGWRSELVSAGSMTRRTGWNTVSRIAGKYEALRGVCLS